MTEIIKVILEHDLGRNLLGGMPLLNGEAQY